LTAAVWATLYRGDLTATTAADGTYFPSNLPPGRHTQRVVAGAPDPEKTGCFYVIFAYCPRRWQLGSVTISAIGMARVVGGRLRRARKAAGLTQAQVARALGKDQSAVSRIEQGEREVRLVEVLELGLIYGIQPEKLVAPLSQEEQRVARMTSFSTNSRDALLPPRRAAHGPLGRGRRRPTSVVALPGETDVALRQRLVHRLKGWEEEWSGQALITLEQAQRARLTGMDLGGTTVRFARLRSDGSARLLLPASFSADPAGTVQARVECRYRRGAWARAEFTPLEDYLAALVRLLQERQSAGGPVMEINQTPVRGRSDAPFDLGVDYVLRTDMKPLADAVQLVVGQVAEITAAARILANQTIGAEFCQSGA
jgi:DNA-binding XRE family transcriptional regulator